jgi:hypothetical protein
MSVNRRFGGACRSACYPLQAGFVFVSFFDLRGRHVPVIRPLTFNGQHGVMFEKIEFLRNDGCEDLTSYNIVRQ